MRAKLDVHIYDQADTDEAVVLPVGKGVAAVFTKRAPGKDEGGNEDAAAIILVDGESGVMIVADGAGGHFSGGKAAQLAVREMAGAIEAAMLDGLKLRNGILNGFESANRAILELGVGAATTLVAVELQNGVARPYHTGDSAILLTGRQGKVKWRTVQHSPVGHALESGLMDEEQAMLHDDRNIVSNLVGSPEMRIEMGPFLKLAKRDTLLLASDGLYDNLLFEEIIERIRRGPLERAADTLVRDCRKRMQATDGDKPAKPDDLTFILFRCA